jgi:hypothetical protein
MGVMATIEQERDTGCWMDDLYFCLLRDGFYGFPKVFKLSNIFD